MMYAIAVTYKATEGVADPTERDRWLLEPAPERTTVIGWENDLDAAQRRAQSHRESELLRRVGVVAVTVLQTVPDAEASA